MAGAEGEADSWADGNEGYLVEGRTSKWRWDSFDVSHNITVTLFGIKAANTCQCCYGHWGDGNGSGL